MRFSWPSSIITRDCAGWDEDSAGRTHDKTLLISALEQIKISLKSCLSGESYLMMIWFNLRKCFSLFFSMYVYTWPKNQSNKGALESGSKRSAVAIEISRLERSIFESTFFGKRLCEHSKERIISWGLNMRRAYMQHYTHKEINEGFKLGWRAEIGDHSRKDSRKRRSMAEKERRLQSLSVKN